LSDDMIHSLYELVGIESHGVWYRRLVSTALVDVGRFVSEVVLVDVSMNG
jgi:hypothetical protein